MPKMNDDELNTIVSSYENDSTAYNSEFMDINEELLRRYNGESYGDEQEGQSQVLATDVADQVDSDMSSLVRVFLGSGDVMVFEPTVGSDEDIEEAEQKSKYVNHIIRNRPGSYKIIHDWMKDAEIQKMGVVHYFMDDIKSTREVRYENITAQRAQELIKELEAESDVIDKVEISGQLETEKDDESGSKFDVKFRITETRKNICINNIPTEDFLISRNSSSEDDATMIGHISFPTRGELVAGGITEEDVAKFPTGSRNNTNQSSQENTLASTGSTMKAIRWRDEGGNLTDASAYSEWANEIVKVVTMYAKVDYDGDGIAERRYIKKIGNTITENEPYDHVPYAILSCLLDPHKAIGRSRASLVVQDQRIQTVLRRGVLNNINKINHSRTFVNEDAVNLDDMLEIQLDGIVRVKGNQPTGSQVMPEITPYIGSQVLEVVQYIDAAKSQRTGALMASQGLESDNLHKETATRFSGVEKASEAKIELVARNFAETGFRKLYDGIAWMAAHYQDTKEEFLVLGKPLSVKPTDWKYLHNPVSKVGLGAGSGQQSVQTMQGIIAMQSQLKAQGSPLVDDTVIYNSLNEMIMNLGLPRTDMFFNNPEVPEQMLMPHIEKLTQALQMAQQQIEQLSQQNPLAEAEMIKQQGAIATADAKNTTELLKVAEQSRLKELEMVQDTAFHDSDKTFDYTKLEVENGVDVPNQGQGQ